MTCEKLINLSRNCKFCTKQFFIDSENVKKSHNSALKRVFCSDKCKNAFGRAKKTNKTEKKCLVCGSVMFVYSSQDKIKKYCTRKCKAKIQSQLRTKEKVECECPKCKKKFFKRPSKYKVFCSRDCYVAPVSKTCITCGKIFFLKKGKGKERRQCSKECKFLDQSRGLIKSHTNGRTGFRPDIDPVSYFKSALEADFARLMKYLDITYEHEKHSFGLLNHTYTPDFYLPEFDLFVELKGLENGKSSFSKMMNRNLKNVPLLKETGIRVIVVTQKEFKQVLKQENLWKEIPNLEQRNYKKTSHLALTHEHKKNNKSCTTSTG